MNRKRVQRLMRQMGIVALYPKSNTNRPGKRHKIYPYLLKGLDINRPNQVSATDLSYIPMAMDGKGRWLDNVFVERLWRSLKYEELYLKAYETVAATRLGIGNYFRFYNCERRHQSLDRQTPDQVYERSVMWPVAA